jgi:hypothetical protein
VRPATASRATLAVGAAALAIAGCGSSSSGSSSPSAKSTTSTPAVVGPTLGPAFPSMTGLPGILLTAPPWSANNSSQLQIRLRRIGLPPLSAEGQVVHIHQHLDIYVNGKHVTLPAFVGIGTDYISELHTHDTTGVMHVESPTASEFSLGQFFAVWGVRLDSKCIGSLCSTATKKLRAWVNGKPVSVNPTRIVLESHQEIVLAYGTAAQVPAPVPASYTFPAGL